MANYKTGAQRYNDRMDKIFKKSEELGNHTLHGSTEAKSKALNKKKGGMMTKKEREWHKDIDRFRKDREDIAKGK